MHLNFKEYKDKYIIYVGTCNLLLYYDVIRMLYYMYDVCNMY